MKRLPLILILALLISCQKEDGDFETTNTLISFSPNISQTDTRATDDYSLSDYFNACPTATVRMITGNEVKTAKYIYKADTQKLEYADGTPLHYPEDKSPYQLIISWPDEETYTQQGEDDYRHQEDENSFIRCDLLGDTINNAVFVDYLPVYFKHLQSKLTFTFTPSSKWDAVVVVAVTNVTVNDYKPFYRVVDGVYQLIYNSSIETAATMNITDNKVLASLVTEEEGTFEYDFRFDASNLKAGEHRQMEVFMPFPYEF
jgi:hypothetical protein